MDCIFCKISAKQLNATFVYEDSEIIAFEDIHPQAPVHTLVVPRKHIATVNDIEAGDGGLMSKMFFVAQEVAKKKGIAEKGYRLIVNCNAEGGQMVFHLHMHVLGGRVLGSKLVK